MSEEIPASADQADSQAASSSLVPVGESIRYRRRAQQAERRAQEVEQQLKDTQSQLAQQAEELASAEAQRDETRQCLAESENRRAAERSLSAAGVTDLETASLLLSKRVDLSEGLDPEEMERQVEQLLIDKPLLHGGSTESAATMPAKTASVRPSRTSATARLAGAAERAIRTGNRRDVAEYLRLRRQTATR